MLDRFTWLLGTAEGRTTGAFDAGRLAARQRMRTHQASVKWTVGGLVAAWCLGKANAYLEKPPIQLTHMIIRRMGSLQRSGVCRIAHPERLAPLMRAVEEHMGDEEHLLCVARLGSKLDEYELEIGVPRSRNDGVRNMLNDLGIYPGGEAQLEVYADAKQPDAPPVSIAHVRDFEPVLKPDGTLERPQCLPSPMPPSYLLFGRNADLTQIPLRGAEEFTAYISKDSLFDIATCKLNYNSDIIFDSHKVQCLGETLIAEEQMRTRLAATSDAPFHLYRTGPDGESTPTITTGWWYKTFRAAPEGSLDYLPE